MRHANKLLTVLVLAFAIPLLYAGAYLALVRNKTEAGITTWDEAYGKWTCEPHYAVGGSFAERFFRPAFLLDRQLRPRYWSMPV